MTHARDGAPRYALSFTSGALLIREATVTARAYDTTRSWNDARRLILDENLLQARTVATAVRRAREVIQRLETLTEPELDLLGDAIATERAALLWVAACRRYDLLAEFAEGVVRERYLLLKPDLGHEHFDGFLRDRGLWHPELDELTPMTRTKLRSNVFKMLEELGAITRSGALTATALTARVVDELEKRDPSDVRLFPTNMDVAGGRL